MLYFHPERHSRGSGPHTGLWERVIEKRGRKTRGCCFSSSAVKFLMRFYMVGLLHIGIFGAEEGEWEAWDGVVNSDDGVCV